MVEYNFQLIDWCVFTVCKQTYGNVKQRVELFKKSKHRYSLYASCCFLYALFRAKSCSFDTGTYVVCDACFFFFL